MGKLFGWNNKKSKSDGGIHLVGIIKSKSDKEIHFCWNNKKSKSDGEIHLVGIKKE